MGKEKCIETFTSVNFKGRDNLGDLDLERRIILKLISKNLVISIPTI
jgi:hypothetical protein